MSRINDALKRAQRAQKKMRRPPAHPGRVAAGASRPGNVIGWILPGVIGILIVAAGLFIGMALLTRTATKTRGESKLLATQPVNPVAVPAPAAAPAPRPKCRRHHHHCHLHRHRPN